ncbi:MAG: hypothetical protein KDD82_29000, partial [Planctomycetes bacterium]|nr:hypothetical protein [Planctomycetota bacterium]
GVRWGGAWGEVSGAGPHAIVHATTVGMHGGPDPTGALLPAEAFTPGSLLYELVYTPRETPLCARARARGARVIDGVAHFAAQARAQLASWCPALEVDDARWARLFDAALEA